jgi:predicted Zn-dependent peptidase
MHNRIIPHEEIIAEIDQVQLEDLEKARLNILKSNITLSSIGPIKNLESLDSIKRRLS